MKTLINKDVISKLKPCKGRFDNYLEHYKDRSFTKAQFMGLKHISQADKLWVAFRLMPKQNIGLAAADIAESVLHIFEAAYPNDLRPRQAIAAARSGDSGAAFANASANAFAAAAAAASYAAFAAASASAHAAYAYAATASASASASTAAYATAAYASDAVSAEDKLKQQKLIRKIVLKYWKEAL